MGTTCTHLDQIRDVTPSAYGCEDCLKTGDTWVHLRECLICGHVGCCDSSKNKHATKHFHTTGHPLVQSFEPGEDWAWCYVDEAFIQPSPAPEASWADRPAGRTAHDAHAR
ncbi:MAG TPA: UBP-type zinc finger domain-containing protein [Thermomicrobiales bacterium]|nr:UBP-type zinc finger domain-containing protein [Thermomicrobiales bacterium]